MYNQIDVDALYPGATIYEAMEVWTLPKHKKSMLKEVCGNGKYFAELKKDGNWYEFVKSSTGESYLFSRGVSTKTGLPVESIKNVPHLEAAMASVPNDSNFVLEVYYEGETTNEVRGIMGCLPAKAIARQKEKGLINFYFHDVIRLSGQDLTQVGAYDRYKTLQECFDLCRLHDHDFIKLAEIIETGIYDFVLQALANGEEGAVLKLKTASYSEGKRPAWSMIKVKKEDKVDVVCMGFDDATIEYTGNDTETWDLWATFERSDVSDKDWRLVSKHKGSRPETPRTPLIKVIPVTKPYYHGWKTSIKIGAYKNGELVQIGTVSSGLTDNLRIKVTSNPDDYIGKVVECECMELTEEALRHPIFKRFRDDKPATSCTFDVIFS